MKKGVARLVKQGVLSPIKYSEWACPSFAIPKKNKTIRFIPDFRGLKTVSLTFDARHHSVNTKIEVCNNNILNHGSLQYAIARKS